MLVFVLGDWRSLAFRGAAAVVFGVLSLVWPRISLTALVLLFGAYALVDGVSILVDAARARGEHQRRWGPLLEGAVSIAAGLVALYGPTSPPSPFSMSSPPGPCSPEPWRSPLPSASGAS